MNNRTEREDVPRYHYTSLQTKAILDTLEKASREARDALADVEAQFHLDTATWGLPFWEAHLGITPSPIATDEERKAEAAQKLVAVGNVTEATIKEMAETLTGYAAEILLSNDYSFTLSLRGSGHAHVEQLDMQPLYDAVEEVKPAHLAFLVPLTWEKLERAKVKWSNLEGKTWDDVSRLVFVEGS